MNKSEFLDEKTVRILIAQLDKSIAQHREEIAKLQEAKRKLVDSQLPELAPRRTSKRRLRRGEPKRLVYSVLREHGPLAVPEIIDKVAETFDIKLADASTRRAVVQLKLEQSAIELEDGRWQLVVKNELPTEEEDDGLPF